MRGVIRVLNTPQRGVVKFPYSGSFIQSQYKQQFNLKERVHQENFNLEKERKYVKIPQTSIKGAKIERLKNLSHQDAGQSLTQIMHNRKSIDDGLNRDFGGSKRLYVKLGINKHKNTIDQQQQINLNQPDPKNSYITTTREAFQNPLLSKYVRSQSTKNGSTLDRDLDLEADYPFPKHSMYRKDFEGWGQGVKLVEKRPEMPRYSLKFNGKSSYKEQCEKSDQMWREIQAKTNFHANLDTQYQAMLKMRQSTPIATTSNITSSNTIQSQTPHQFGNDHLITLKMKNDRKIEEVIERSKERDQIPSYGFYRGQQMIRPKSALETSYSAVDKMRASQAHFDTSYKKNFIEHLNSRPLYVPYP